MTDKARSVNDMNGAGRSPEQTELLKRVFEGLEIVDATANIIINVTEEDSVGAVANDLENCVLARTCRRMYGSSRLAFMKTVVYVDYRDEHGVLKVHRHLPGGKMKKAVEIYDTNKGLFPIPPGTYTLLAPPPSCQLNKLREDSKERRKKPEVKNAGRQRGRRRRALIKAGAWKVKNKNYAGPQGVVRNGTGLVQTKKEA